MLTERGSAVASFFADPNYSMALVLETFNMNLCWYNSADIVNALAGIKHGSVIYIKINFAFWDNSTKVININSKQKWSQNWALWDSKLNQR